MPKRIFIALSVAVLSLFFAVPKSGAAITLATAEEILALAKAQPSNLLLLDVRTPGEYAEGHISGARLMPMREVPGRLSEIPRDRIVIVVCATGARSGAVTEYLLKNGYSKVKNYGGGMSDWGRRGLPVER